MKSIRVATLTLLAMPCLFVGCSQSGGNSQSPNRQAEVGESSDTELLAQNDGEEMAAAMNLESDSFEHEAVVQAGIDSDTTEPEGVVESPGKPGVTQKLIDKVALGPGEMYQVYDLMFDYDMARISDADYQYLGELVERAGLIQEASTMQSHLQTAYDVAATGGEATFSYDYDPQAMFSTPKARLETLKGIIDNARGKRSE